MKIKKKVQKKRQTRFESRHFQLFKNAYEKIFWLGFLEKMALMHRKYTKNAHPIIIVKKIITFLIFIGILKFGYLHIGKLLYFKKNNQLSGL